MSASSSKPQSRRHLHVIDTSATAAAAATNGSAASPGPASSSHHHSSRAPRATPTGIGTGGGGGGVQVRHEQINPACAACKYQRRKCSPDCPLAPYFPADQQRRFINAHRLFGVSNIQKTLRRIDPKYGPDAMRALIYQSEARAADPVGGCVGIIEELNRQIRDTEMELQFVRQQIAIYRQASATDGGGLSDPAAAAAAMILPAASAAAGQDDMIAAVDAIYAAGGQQPSVPAGGGSGPGLVFHDQQDYHVVKAELEHNNPSSSHQQQLYDYFCDYNGTSGDEATSDDGGMQQYGFADVVDSSAVKAAGSPVALLGEQLGQQQHCQIGALPFMDAFDVKPQVLPVTIQHQGPAAAAAAAAGNVLNPEQKQLATPGLVMHDDVDEHMEEEEEQEATAGAYLELGF